MYAYKYAWSLKVFFFKEDEVSLNVSVGGNGNILVTSVVVLVVVEE